MSTTTYHQLQSFIEYLKFERRYSQHTVISYQTDLEQFFAFLTSQYDSPPLADISAGFVRSWLAEMRNEDITPKTLNRKISALKSFFKYQIKLGELKQSPMTTIVSPKMGKRLPSFVAQKEMDNLQQYGEFADNL